MINIYSVTNHLESEGWKLISDSYKNLTTELEMECPNGHKLVKSYGAWRKKPLCDICLAGDTTKVQKNKVPPKNEDTRRILALDAATTINGYAIYDNDVLISYGTFKVNKDLPIIERINKVKKWLTAAITDWQIDFLGLENIQLQNNSYGRMSVEVYKALAQLQGVLLDSAFEACIDYDLVYPTGWRKSCGISDGDAHRENKKKQAQEKVKLWYNQDCTQDEADAICIGKYFCGKLKNLSSSWGEKL